MSGATGHQDAALAPPLSMRPIPGAADERALVRSAQRGSRDAVEALVRRHWHDAHRAAYLIVGDGAAAEDIAQESLLAAIASIERFDSRRPLGPWLHRIVANRSVDWLRSRARRRESPASAAPEAGCPDPDALSGDLMTALAGLPLDDRAIVVMRHLLDLPSSEIGRALEMPAATVRTRLSRALDELRGLLEADDDRKERP